MARSTRSLLVSVISISDRRGFAGLTVRPAPTTPKAKAAAALVEARSFRIAGFSRAEVARRMDALSSLRTAALRQFN
jgi:hypothetical protein